MQLIASLNGKYFVESKYEPKYFVALKRREKNRKKSEKKRKKTKKSDRENGKKNHHSNRVPNTWPWLFIDDEQKKA